jgi:hypothetical protein
MSPAPRSRVFPLSGEGRQAPGLIGCHLVNGILCGWRAVKRTDAAFVLCAHNDLRRRNETPCSDLAMHCL